MRTHTVPDMTWGEADRMTPGRAQPIMCPSPNASGRLDRICRALGDVNLRTEPVTAEHLAHQRRPRGRGVAIEAGSGHRIDDRDDAGNGRRNRALRGRFDVLQSHGRVL